MKKRKEEKQIWEEYGFQTEEEFRKKYPNAGRLAKKAGSKVSRQKRKLLSKQEQMELNRINSRGMN